MKDYLKFIYRDYFKYGIKCSLIDGRKMYSLPKSPYGPYDLTDRQYYYSWGPNIQLFMKYGVFK